MHYSTFADMAAGIAAQTKRHKAIVITPLLQAPVDSSLASIGALPDDSVWAAHALIADRKDRFRCESICFGLVKTMPPLGMSPELLARRNASSATREQAADVRAGLIEALRGHFDEVFTPDDPLENARICARVWPGEQSAKMLKQVIARAASQIAGHA